MKPKQQRCEGIYVPAGTAAVEVAKSRGCWRSSLLAMYRTWDTSLAQFYLEKSFITTRLGRHPFHALVVKTWQGRTVLSAAVESAEHRMVQKVLDCVQKNHGDSEVRQAFRRTDLTWQWHFVRNSLFCSNSPTSTRLVCPPRKMRFLAQESVCSGMALKPFHAKIRPDR